MCRSFRKPLIVVAPKKMLKFRSAMSTIDEFAEGTSFRKILPDMNESAVADAKIKKVIYCSGQVYYDLESRRK